MNNFEKPWRKVFAQAFRAQAWSLRPERAQQNGELLFTVTSRFYLDSGGEGGVRTHVPSHHRQPDFESQKCVNSTQKLLHIKGGSRHDAEAARKRLAKAA